MIKVEHEPSFGGGKAGSATGDFSEVLADAGFLEEARVSLLAAERLSASWEGGRMSGSSFA